MPQVYESMPLPLPLSIATVSPKPSDRTETTEAKLYSHQAQEEPNAASIGSGDANLITKPEPAEAPCNNHNNYDNRTKDEPACNNSNITSNTDHSSSNHNNAYKPGNISIGDNNIFVHDLGGICLKIKDDVLCDNNNSSVMLEYVLTSEMSHVTCCTYL